MLSCPVLPHPGCELKFLIQESSIGKTELQFSKKQKELARKKKIEEKRQRKLNKNALKPAEAREVK